MTAFGSTSLSWRVTVHHHIQPVIDISAQIRLALGVKNVAMSVGNNYTWTEKDDDDLTPMTKENVTLDELRRTWMAKLNDNCLFISAKEKQNIDEFREVVYKRVRELHVQKYPYNDFLYNDVEEM